MQLAATPIAKSRWLKLDDAAKWQFIKWMRGSMPSQGCTAVLAHYGTPYGQGMYAEAGEIPKYSDWKQSEGDPNVDFPPGMSVISPKTNDADPSWICAITIQNGFSQFANIPVPIKTIGNAKTPNISSCQGPCVEVDIGNEPESTPMP